jgi:hypothetical protein
MIHFILFVLQNNIWFYWYSIWFNIIFTSCKAGHQESWRYIIQKITMQFTRLKLLFRLGSKQSSIIVNSRSYQQCINRLPTIQSSSFTILDIEKLELLEALHEGLGSLTSMTHHGLSRCNSLTTLPEGLEILTSLTDLEMSHHSSLTTLPEGLRDLICFYEAWLVKMFKLHNMTWRTWKPHFLAKYSHIFVKYFLDMPTIEWMFESWYMSILKLETISTSNFELVHIWEHKS